MLPLVRMSRGYGSRLDHSDGYTRPMLWFLQRVNSKLSSSRPWAAIRMSKLGAVLCRWLARLSRYLYFSHTLWSWELDFDVQRQKLRKSILVYSEPSQESRWWTQLMIIGFRHISEPSSEIKHQLRPFFDFGNEHQPARRGPLLYIVA
jgi:hypothetical protein